MTDKPKDEASSVVRNLAAQEGATPGTLPVDQRWLGDWMKSIHGQLEKQTDKLSGINTAVTFLAVLALLGVVVGGCSAVVSLMNGL
jgi:hypothetical protein